MFFCCFFEFTFKIYSDWKSWWLRATTPHHSSAAVARHGLGARCSFAELTATLTLKKHITSQTLQGVSETRRCGPGALKALYLVMLSCKAWQAGCSREPPEGYFHRLPLSPNEGDGRGRGVSCPGTWGLCVAKEADCSVLIRRCLSGIHTGCP